MFSLIFETHFDGYKPKRGNQYVELSISLEKVVLKVPNHVVCKVV